MIYIDNILFSDKHKCTDDKFILVIKQFHFHCTKSDDLQFPKLSWSNSLVYPCGNSQNIVSTLVANSLMTIALVE